MPHIQHQRAIELEDRHRPAWASSERNVVTNREMLKVGQNARGARPIEVAEEAIEPVVAIQPAALIATLGKRSLRAPSSHASP